ncbi:hypothetical protein ACS0TY_020699 [Phlomoides rotata]
MALGYLGSNVGDMELKGRECFNVLAMRSLFQDFEMDDLNEKIRSCKMHDIVHQFIRKSGRVEVPRTNKTICQGCDPLLVSTVNEFCSLFWYDDKESPPTLCNCVKHLRVLSMNGCRLRSIPQGMENLIHLRWLDLTGKTLSDENLKIIFRLFYLQTLILSACSLEEISREIGNLIHLRHLDLSYNSSLRELPGEIENLIHLRRLNLNWNKSLEKLPREIGNLVHLKRLDLKGSWSLKLLPSEIENLIHLKHLDLYQNGLLKELPESICGLHELTTLNILCCMSLRKIPEGLCQLTGLRTLGDFHGGSGLNKLGLLKNLNHLSGLLRLFIRLSDDDDLEEVVEDARKAELKNKIHIQRLLIEFEDEMDKSEDSSCMIDALEPHPDLRKLYIMKYKGSKLPLTWIISPLNQLRYIMLCECNHLSSLPPLGKLPYLEDIEIDRVGGLEFVGREFLGITRGGVAFPKLKTLSFRDCPKWKEWEDITIIEEEHSTIMPCLIVLTIINCNRLTKLPRSLLSKAWPVEKLYIIGSDELQQHCRENGLVFVDSF